MSKREQRVEKEQYWRLVLDEFGASGLTVREFCKREGLREPSFYAWRKEIRRRDGDMTGDVPNGVERKRQSDGVKKASRKAPSAPSLIEVVTRSTPVTQAIEIETPTGFIIRLGEQVDRELMTSVLSSMLPLEQASC